VIYLLDTNTCIGYLNGTAVGVLQQLQTLSPQEIAVCSVVKVKAELFYGAMKSANPTKTLALQRQFLDRFVSFPFSTTTQQMNTAVSALNSPGKAPRLAPTT
jgi:tRNA(fMet)-specific endonuclease VapC